MCWAYMGLKTEIIVSIACATNCSRCICDQLLFDNKEYANNEEKLSGCIDYRWKAFSSLLYLTSCNIELTSYFELKPENGGKYIKLSNAYASSGLWDKVAKVRGDTRKCGMKKEPSYSWVEVQQKVHYFFMGDNSHKQTDEVYDLIKDITCALKNQKYVSDLMNE